MTKQTQIAITSSTPNKLELKCLNLSTWYGPVATRKVVRGDYMMVSVIEHHALFQLKDGVKEAQETANKHFDEYDHTNQKDARKFLLNSVDEHLEKQLYENCSSDD